MSTITITLISLLSSSSTANFLADLEKSGVRALTIARVIQWIITPTKAEYLLDHAWDYMLVLEASSAIPVSVATAHIAQTTSIQLQLPFESIDKFKASQEEWLHPDQIPPPNYHIDGPPVSGGPLVSTSSSQTLELTPGLLSLAQSNYSPWGTISFLNFTSLRPLASARASYAAYKQAFKIGPGQQHGPVDKIVGVTDKQNVGWDEVMLQQFPTKLHFADCIAGKEFQKMNFELRLPSLRDFGMLMVSELELDWSVAGSAKRPET